MPTPQDEEFVRFAVAGGHLTPVQGDEALAGLAEIERLGGAASAAPMLQRRGLLTERQVGLIHEAIASSKTATKVPREIGSFELLEKLGQGGTGTVFKARQKGLDRFVALKILSPRLARSEDFVARFRREARAGARLRHPNIVAAIDVGQSEGFHYFAMEHVEGETLAQVLKREGRLAEGRALAIASEVAAALDHAHSAGVLHRDIRPENVMLAADGRVRVTDFGLAKPVGRDAPSSTDSERFLGTPAYLAPEEIRSEPDIDCRADIYSLGVTLFQMLTGELPFRGTTPMAVAAAAVAEPVPSLRTLRPDVRIATSRLVDKMTAKDRGARFAAPGELLAALKSAASAPARPGSRVAGGAPRQPAATRPARPAARRRKSRVGAYVVAAVGISIHVVLFTWLFPKVLRRWDEKRRTTQVAPVPTTEAPVRTSVPVYAPATSTPSVTPQPTVADRALEALRAAAARAREFARRNPQAYASQIARIRKILGDFSGERQQMLPRAGFELLLELRAELKRLQGAAKAAADAELATRRARADTLVKAGKVAEALRLFDSFPPELSTEATAPEVQRLRDEYRQRARHDLQALDATGRKLIEQGSLEQARALYVRLKEWQIPEAARRSRQALATIDKLLAERSAVVQQRAVQAYAKAVRTLVERLAARDYGRARKLVDTALVAPELVPVRGKLRPFHTLVRAAAEVWAGVRAGARKLKPGETVRLGGVAGELVRIEGDKVHLTAGSAAVVRRLTDLRSGEALALARAAFGAVTPQVEAKFGLFLLAERDYAGARARLNAAKEKGADVAAGLDLMARIAPRPCPQCNGAKMLTCPRCNGQGYSHADRRRCEACNGRGWFVCRKCRGRGSLRCARCNGTGHIMGGFRCTDCGGDGRVDCASCKKGKIRCKTCKGDGVITKYTICDRCKGKKKIPCAKCGGKGFLPPLDLPPTEKPE